MGKAILKLLPSSLVDTGEAASARAPKRIEISAAIDAEVRALRSLIEDPASASAEMSFFAFEKALIPRVFRLARLFVTLFLCVREEWHASPGDGGPAMADGQRYERRPAQARNLSTFFGAVRYWRTYMRGPAVDGERHGFHPLDLALGLTADRISMHLLSLAARLATKLSFAQVHATLKWFLQAAPSTEVIEQTVLGIGRWTGAWFQSALAPAGDGDVLIVMFDSKGAPTATDSELLRRRRKRRKRKAASSPRHRGRQRRKAWGEKPRRQKGDKSKNAKMATMVVLYTLRRSGKQLLGPINKWVYASFAPKRHAFEVARREANKRGFTPGSGKLIQVLSDGDNDFADYVKEYFPEAIHTVDVMHVMEYVWTAGACILPEGSHALARWVAVQKGLLYGGRADLVLDELRQHLAALPRSGPGNKGKRERLSDAIAYLEKRIEQMNYRQMMAKDLEIATGAVEGAIKHVVGYRFDHGGMRWIRERAEALLQLRCIEINGDWDRFLEFVHDRVQGEGLKSRRPVRVQQRSPSPLPVVAEAA
jgi:hypothetical protein